MSEIGSGATYVVIRSTTRWLVGGIYFVIAFAGVISLVLGSSLPRILLIACVVAGLLVLAGRAVRSAIEVSDACVTARADRFTKRLQWSEIHRFELRTVKLTTGLGAWMTDGSWVRLMDCGLDSRNRYESAVEVLQAELARRR